MNHSPERIMGRYDAIVNDSGRDGAKVAEVRGVVTAEVVADPEQFGIPTVETLIEAYVGAVIGDQRNSRARSRIALFHQCHDAVTGMTLMGKDDPVLDIALRTGTSDGLDKSLRHFTVEDWLDVLGASARNVADAIEADKELRETVNPIIAAYATRGADCFEDML